MPAAPTRVLPTVLAGGYAAGSVALVFGTMAPTTYAAASLTAAAATLSAGLSLLAGGLTGWWRQPARGPGGVVLALGVVWLAPVWVGWDGGPPIARSLAMLVAPLLPALLLHLAAAYPRGRAGTPVLRATVLLGWLLVGGYAVARAVLRNPFLDLYCWSNCQPSNVLLLVDRPGLARDLDTGWHVAATAVALVAVVVSSARLARTTRLGRLQRVLVLMPVTAASLAEAAYSVVLMARPLENPAVPLFLAVFMSRAATLTAVGAGYAWAVARDRERARALTLIHDDLGKPAPGADLENRLAEAFGDPSLRLLLRLPDGRVVDRDGTPATSLINGRGNLPIVRDGQTLALVSFDHELVISEDLLGRVGSMVRLVIDNERLRAQLLAQLADLTASRARLVAAADQARRRIERDLHDGAQQRMLALVYELRMAKVEATAHGDPIRAAQIGTQVENATEAVDELREIAHGIYPAVLDHGDLEAGLLGLAESASVPVEITYLANGRASGAAEQAAYLVAAEGVSRFQPGETGHVEIEVRRADDTLTLTVNPFAGEAPQHLVDRIGALGGRINTTGAMLCTEVPCA